MDTKGNDQLREMLAAQYALGTLRGGARRRFERWMRTDSELRALTFAWGERLAPLVGHVAPIAPPKRVWDQIEARLPGLAARHQDSGHYRSISLWDRLGLWRGLSAAFATAAVVAVLFAIKPPPAPVEKIVQVDVVPTSIANVVDPKTNALVAVVMQSGKQGDLLVKIADDVAVPEGKVLQLWIAPNDAKDMVSMGLLPPVAKGAPVRITAVDAHDLARAKAFGLSLEPAGGSPQPTQVLGLGALVRLSS
jgi:anti-sigma-K factor RskA